MSEDELKIIDDPVFQRLRRIKQLSFAYMAYHGAEHSRFGHVLGTMHVVDRAVQKIQKNSRMLGTNTDLTEDDIKLARFAALLHDVGHQPFSHALDKVVPINHEKYSATIVENRYGSILEKSHVDPKDVTRLILGQPQKKPFLRSLISGQLDVDKLDYLLRDSHYAGVKYGVFDLERILDSLFVVDNDLVIFEDGYLSAEQLIVARYYMFEQVYNHHTKRAFEGMARKIAKFMFENNELYYPKIEDLNESSKLIKFGDCDDAWFLRSIHGCSDKSLVHVAKSIENRIPFKVIVDSEDIRRKMLRSGDDPAGCTGFVTALEIDLASQHSSLGISESEIMSDGYNTIPYKLRPYIRSPKEKDEEDEPDIVYIYDNKTGYKEPIEKRSILIEKLASTTMSTRRIYVDRNQYETISSFLKNKYKKYF